MIRSRGFTLVELVASLGVTSIILGALGSVFVLSASALPGTRGAQVAIDRAEVGVALSRLNDDLLVATRVRKANSRAVVLTLPDRTDDGQPETVTWAWSGTAGEPLTRTQNGEPAEIILPNVTTLSLAFTLRSQTPLASGLPSAGTEVLVASGGSEANSSTVAVTAPSSVAQSFRVALPADAISWTPSRIRLRARTSGLIDGSTDIQLRTAVAGTISIGGTTLFGATIAESSLSGSGGWINVPVSGVSPLPVTAVPRLSLALAHRGGVESMRAFVHAGPQPVGTDFYTGVALTSTWVDAGSRSLNFEVYARVLRTPPAAAATHRLCGVDVGLTTPRGALRTTMLLPNEPGVIP